MLCRNFMFSINQKKIKLDCPVFVQVVHNKQLPKQILHLNLWIAFNTKLVIIISIETNARIQIHIFGLHCSATLPSHANDLQDLLNVELIPKLVGLSSFQVNLKCTTQRTGFLCPSLKTT